jgi:PAS domain S-box-containing protein
MPHLSYCPRTAHFRTVDALKGLIFFVTIGFFLFLSVDGRADTPAPPVPAVLSAAEIDYPPFSIVDESGRADGFSVELLRSALAAMGREVVFRTGLWPEVRGWLENGEVRALPLVGRTPEREPLFDFTFPYMSLHGAIVVRKGTFGIRSLEDLKGRQVAVMQGDNAEEFLRREDRGVDIITRPSFDVALQELANGRYDAVFIQRLVALRLIQKSGISGLEVIQYPVEDFRQDFCFAVKKGDSQTLALLNEGLSLVIADGTYRRLHAKWFAALQLPTNRPVIVGGDHDYPPFEYLDENGRPAGFTVALTQAIAREMNMDVQIRLGPWMETVQGLVDGDIDAIQGMFYSVERDRVLDFSPFHRIHYYVGAVRKDRGPPPQTVQDLAGRKLVAQKGDVILDFLAEKGLASGIALKETQREVLQAVSDGLYDCALVPRISALYLMENNNWPDLVLGKNSFFTGEYAYAVKQGQSALLAQFSEGLKLLEQSGEYRRIQDKWLGFYQEETLPVIRVLRYLAMVVVPLVLVLVGMLLWSRSLQRQVARKTRELNDSLEFQQAMIACSPVALYCIDFKGKVTEWNDSARNMFGWAADEVLGRPLPNVPEDRSHEFDVLRREVVEKGTITGVELVRQKKGGALFDVSLSSATIRDSRGNMIGIMSAAEDITERKRAQKHIQHLNQVLRAIRDVNQLIIHEQDPESLIREGCRLLVAHHGYPSAMIVRIDSRNKPLSWAMAGLAEESVELDQLLKQGELTVCCRRAQKAGKPVIITDQKTECRSCPISEGCSERVTVCMPLVHMGETFGFLSVAAENGLSEADEEYTLLYEMGQDFAYALSSLKIDSERKKGIAALDESEQRFKTFAELAPVGIVISDDQENTLYASPKFIDMFGYTLEDMSSVDQWWSLAYPDQELREQIMQKWRAAVEHAVRTGLEIVPMEYPVTCKDGTVRDVEFRAASTGKINIVVFTDISDRKKHEREQQKLQAQLIQAQKMESVGRLAGGVAHDFNNMLNVIIGYAELGMIKTTPDHPLHDHLNQIIDAARRSSDITRKLLAFARKQTIQPKVLDLNETVESMLKMLRRLIGEEIDLSWQPGGGVWPVFLDKSQVDQILANLVVNARDAIAGVGKITIETENIGIDTEYCAIHAGFVPGEFVMLAVSDDGCGIDKDIQKKLFEPFFSTKEKGKGTGLGLATVYGIVKQNNGFINVYSEPGSGTTFRIYLPRHDGEPDQAGVNELRHLPRGTGETIMVVEDEDAIRILAGKVLETLGYRVMEAAFPEQALDLVKTEGDRIDLLLIDVVMPQMNGRELADAMHALYPDIKVLFMSGYTANVIAHRGILDSDVNFIQKPFSNQGLALKIREILDGTGR